MPKRAASRQQERLYGDSPLPRYAQLSTVLRRRIERGVWPAASQVPTIESLMSEFGVARVTVRQAINVLATEGLLSAHRGRGTFVSAQPQRRESLRLATTLAAIADIYRHDEPTLTLIDEAVATPTLQPGEGKAAPRYRFLRRVHSRNGEAYCAISIYLDERVFRKAPARFRRHTVVPVLLDLPGVSVARAWQTLTIGIADVEVARLIGMPVHGAVGEVRRVCQDAGGTVIYLGEVTYRGDYIRLEMDLEP